MSKFGCQCGHTISTVEYPNSIEGWIYGIEAEEEFEPEIAKALADYFATPAGSQKQRWLEKFFSKTYPQRLADTEVATDIIRTKMAPYLRDVLECPSCGRLHVQLVPGENRYRSYAPEPSAQSGILKVKKNA